MLFEEFLTGQVFGLLLVLCRISAIIAFIPGLGEQFAPARLKIGLSVALSLVIYPISPVVGNIPDSFSLIVRLMATEITVGIFLGLISRCLMTALQYAGQVIGQTSALANAFAADNASFQGATMISTFLLVSGITMIFITDTHHIMIGSFVTSYKAFPLGFFPIESMTAELSKAVSSIIYLGVALSAPFFIVGLLVNIGMGLANKMMPTLSVFFVASPLLIFIGLLTLYVAAPFMITGILRELNLWLTTFSLTSF
jgi:flagellar biosynthetic protein FliR